MERLTRTEAAQTLRASVTLEQRQSASAVAATAVWCTGAPTAVQALHAAWAASHMSKNRGR